MSVLLSLVRCETDLSSDVLECLEREKERLTYRDKDKEGRYCRTCMGNSKKKKEKKKKSSPEPLEKEQS